MASQFSGRYLAIAGLVAALAASGCASLLNPYVRATELDARGIGAAGVPESIVNSPQTRALQAAVDLAAIQRTAYYDAVSDRAKLRNGLPLALIPLSAMAIFKGMTSDGGAGARNVLLKEGLVGASIFGLGSYFTSTTREKVYLAGAKALSCSIYAATPFYLTDELERGIEGARQREVHRRTQEVRRLSQSLRQSLLEIVDAEPSLANTVAVKFADPLLLRARKSIASANKIALRTSAVQAAVANAPARLRWTLENIVDQVNQQIAAIEPDPATILTLTAGLGATAKQFAPGVEFTPSGSAKDKIGEVNAAIAETSQQLRTLLASAKALAQKLATAVDGLDDEADALQFATDLVARHLQSAPALDTCQVQSVKGRIDISPPDTEVEMHVGEARQFTVRSTVGIPSVEWVGTFSLGNVQPVSLRKQIAGNTVLVVATFDKQVPGLSQVAFEVADASLQSRTTITLTLNDAVPPKDASGSTPPPDPATSTPTAGQPAKPASAPGVPLLLPPGPQNAFEKTLSPERLQQLQVKLKLPVTGVLDTATRSAVQNWQITQAMPERNGSLSTATVTRIMMP